MAEAASLGNGPPFLRPLRWITLPSTSTAEVIGRPPLRLLCILRATLIVAATPRRPITFDDSEALGLLEAKRGLPWPLPLPERPRSLAVVLAM